MKEAKRVQITDQICKQAKLMRKGGANQMEIAALLGINGSTVSRLEAAGFDLATYTENRKLRKEKEEARKLLKQQTKEKERPKVRLIYDPSIAEEYRREQEAKQAEEQVPGQMRMDLIPEKPEMSDQVKMMRFIAGQVDKLYMKLETINDTVSQILRATRGD